ncbi:MAG: hypothetical protein Kow0062_00510 [Acidobacteriota bacterium]
MRRVPDRSEPIRVLVVDDSPAFLEAARALVEHEPGLDLAGTAADGREALAACVRLRPDLVLIDAFMPGLDGFEATRELRRAGATVRIVVISLNDDPALRAASRAAGADAFVPKGELADRLGTLACSLGSAPRRGMAPPEGREPPPGPRTPPRPGVECSAAPVIDWRQFLGRLWQRGRRGVVSRACPTTGPAG